MFIRTSKPSKINPRRADPTSTGSVEIERFLSDNISQQEYLVPSKQSSSHSMRRWLSRCTCSTHHSPNQTFEGFSVGLVHTGIN